MKRYFLFLVVTSAVTALTLSAQEPLRGPDGGTTYHVAGVELLSIPGKPFSAKSRTDWTRTLEDGTVVKTHLEANLGRDNQGRIYRERRSFVPDGSDQSSRLLSVMIYDPVAHTQTICPMATRHCIVTGYHGRTSFVPMSVGPFDKGTRYLTRDSIGTDVLDGLNVIGTRETITINAGVLGNERALVSTREFWYSPDLETNLSITRKDPRLGKQVIHLSEISRTEPDSAKFQVPAGFTVEDVRTPSVQQ